MFRSLLRTPRLLVPASTIRSFSQPQKLAPFSQNSFFQFNQRTIPCYTPSRTFSSKPAENEVQEGDEDKYDLDQLFGNNSPLNESAVFSIIKGNMGLRVGYFNNSVFLQMAHPREGLPKAREVSIADYEWAEAKIFVLLNVYDTAKFLAVLDGLEQRLQINSRIEDDGGVPAFDQNILLTRSSESATSAASDSKAWKSLYTLSISHVDLQQKESPASGTIHLDAGDVMLISEHLRKSLITLFGFTQKENSNPFDIDPEDLEEVLNNQMRDPNSPNNAHPSSLELKKGSGSESDK